MNFHETNCYKRIQKHNIHKLLTLIDKTYPDLPWKRENKEAAMLVACVNELNSSFIRLTRNISYERSLAQTAYPASDYSSFLKRGKMWLRFLMFRRYHRQVRDIFQDHRLQNIARSNPRIYEKIYRAYLFNGATMNDRLRILKSNYKYISDVFSVSLIHAIFVSRDFTLCSISLPHNDDKIVARLAYLQRFEKEGELTLCLQDNNGNRLYSVSFTFLVSNGRPMALIGCVIGMSPAKSGNWEVIKYLTKRMHGMRPKNLLIYLLQVLCRELGIQELLAITSQSHIYEGSAKNRLRIKFDYDKFWEEVEGRRLDQYFYSLPLHHTRRSFEEIRSNKRAAYARRYAILDDLEAQIQSALQGVIERSFLSVNALQTGTHLKSGGVE
jgi:uncharacterized protein VirK/YbjX